MPFGTPVSNSWTGFLAAHSVWPRRAKVWRNATSLARRPVRLTGVIASGIRRGPLPGGGRRVGSAGNDLAGSRKDVIARRPGA